MKKALSLLLVVLMLVGMLPMTVLNASAAEVSETIALAGSTGTVSGESISWTSGNLAFTANKNTSSTAIRTTDTDHFRLYVGFSATLTCSAGTIKKIEMVATGSSYASAPTGADGSVGTVSGTTITIVPNESSNAYTIPNISKQTRIKSITVTYEDPNATGCAHTNTETVEAVAATCTKAGNTAGVKCTDCGATVSGNETIEALGHKNDAGVVTAPTCTEDGYTTYTCTVCGSSKKSDYVDATGHNYVDGVCSGCNAEQPTGLAGKYYIAAIRSSGNYFYMTNDLGTASTKRYQIVDSGLTTLPTSIETVVDAQVFELIYDASAGTYKIKTGDKYLGWTSGNSGALVDEATAIAATIDPAEDGAYNIHFAASDAERYLALNKTTGSDYFAWYKQGQAEDLRLVPVASEGGEGGSEACAHANQTTTTVDATCTDAGSTTVVCDDCGETISTEEIAALGHNYVDNVCSRCGAEFEGEIDTPDATGRYELATSISAGDTVIIVSKDAGMELSSFSTTSTVYGLGTAYTDVPAGTMTWTVEEGTVAGSYAFKNADGNYLYWSSGNSLKANATKDAQASWNVSFDGNDVILVNAGTVDVARHISWNNSSPRFANYKDASVAGNTGYNTIQFYKYVSGEACAHIWSDWSETTAATCTDKGVETATCTLCGETKTQPIDALGHSFVYTETAITCANCDYSAAYTLSPIADAKAFTDENQVYYVKGIVTYVSGNKVYIEDATGALLVMFNGEDGSGIALGDEILVWDCLTTYNGLIETTYTLASEYVKVSSGNALPSQTVTIADLLADTTNEYLSERVVIENVTIGTINTSGNTALTDADGNAINIYKVSGLSEDINENDTVTATVIVSTYNGYQLLVNPGTAATDVVETAAGEEEVVTTVTIAEAKAGTAGEYYQVEGVVTYISGRNVYIQDATGGIVVYLAANAATTQVGDSVKAYGALKVYNGLIELDAVDETNAEFYSILSNGNTVDAQAVTMAELAADTTNEYLAEKISLTGVYVSHYSYNNSYKNVTYTLVDGNGNTIQIYRVTVASEEECIAGGSVVNVEAVVSTYNGYQLVTTNDKITVTGTCAHETTEIVNAKDATCTEAGYTGDTMCTVCQNYTARGEEIAASGHTEETVAGYPATCTEDGLTDGVKCTVCGEFTTAQEVIPAGGHTMESVVTAPTCTEMGYTTNTCTVCGETETEDYIPALGHTMVDGVCSVCNYDENLKFYRSNTSGGDLQLGDDIRATFMVRPLEYDDIYLEVTKDGKTTIVEKGPTSNSSVFRYAYVVPAAHMTMDINLTIWGVKDGVTYRGEELVFSVRGCAEAKLDAWINNPAAAGQCKLLMNMLYYGEKAQLQFGINTDNLATTGLDQKYLDLIITGVPSLKAYPTVDTTGKIAILNTMGFMLQEKVKLNVIFTLTSAVTNPEEYQVVVKHIPSKEGATPVTYTYTSDDFTLRNNNKAIQFYFDKIAPSQMRDDVEYTVYHNGEAISATYVRSMETVAQYYATNAPALTDLINAIMNYADAAKAVFG